MPILAHFTRRPTAVVWIMALLFTILALAVLRLPPVTPQTLIGAMLIAMLIGIGDWFAVMLEDGGALSPAPALLIAGLSAAGWPLLVLAALAGTLAPAFRHAFEDGSLIHNEHPKAGRYAEEEHAPWAHALARMPLREAGARLLIVGLLAPIYPWVEAQLPIPYSTPLGLLGLLLLGMLAYMVVLGVGALDTDRAALLARWRGSARWYAPAMIALGGLLGVLWSVGPWAFLLGLAPLALAHHAFRDQVALRRAAAEFANLSVQSESLSTRLERLQALATTMIGTFDVQAMLELLRERLAALLDADYGWVVLREEDGRPRLIASRRLASADEPAPALADPQRYTRLFERGTVMLVTDERLATLAPVASDPASWMAVMSIPLIGDQGVLGVICLAFAQLRGLDVDEQRMLTSFARQAATVIENARLFDELHRKQAELIQSSKMAAVGTFAAGIAHEFNNLLAGMLGHAELGHRIADIEEKNRSLEVVIQSCQRGRSITKGLLTFARRQDHKRQLADLTEAINETLMLVEVDLRKSQIAVVRQLELVSPTICDLGQLSQVVLNLVTNARDAMKPQGGTLTIGLREHDGAIEISVIDTGTGIPEQIRDKIFEPFVTTKGALGGSQTPGTGLGLSVSYGIVRDHGGEILVASEVGRGTTMTVRLPVVVERIEQAMAVGER
ncbi:MAG: sensor histidine kinase [Roseiflexaceae bacterium]